MTRVLHSTGHVTIRVRNPRKYIACIGRRASASSFAASSCYRVKLRHVRQLVEVLIHRILTHTHSYKRQSLSNQTVHNLYFLRAKVFELNLDFQRRRPMLVVHRTLLQDRNRTTSGGGWARRTARQEARHDRDHFRRKNCTWTIEHFELGQ